MVGGAITVTNEVMQTIATSVFLRALTFLNIIHLKRLKKCTFAKLFS
jgi:hypothetical protein